LKEDRSSKKESPSKQRITSFWINQRPSIKAAKGGISKEVVGAVSSTCPK